MIIGGLDVDALPPVQRRVVVDLLAVGQPRPLPDDSLPGRLRDIVEGRLAPVVEQRDSRSRTITLGKTQLDALACDGRYLDLLAAEFAWSHPTVRGQLVHRSVALDHHMGRSVATAELLGHAWEEFSQSGEGATAWAGTQSPLQVASLQAEAVTVVEEYRETFPLLPETWRIVFEPTITTRFGAGAVAVRGRPDLVLGKVVPHERRMMLVDLKTGNRSSKDMQDMRWYALLATFKYRQAPFKIATFYVDEGTWVEEEVDEGVLEAAARGLVDRLETALRLTDRPEVEVLVAGPMCRWCGRAPTCPERERADAEHEAATALR